MGLRKPLMSSQQRFLGLADNIRFTRVSFENGLFLCKPHALVNEDGSLTPFLETPPEGGIDFGNWIESVDIARIYLPTGSIRIPFKSGDFSQMSPIDKLEREITAARSSGIAPPLWDSVFPPRTYGSSGKQNRLSITMERGCVLFLATVLMERNTLSKETGLQLVQVTRSTGVEMVRLLDTMPPGTDLLNDPNLALEIVPVPARRENQAIIPNHYEVRIVALDPQRMASGLSAYKENQQYILSKKIGCPHLITIPSNEEQIFHLVKSSVPPSALAYALEDFKDLFPQKYWEVATAELGAIIQSKTAPQQGYSQPQQGYSQPPQGRSQPLQHPAPQIPAQFSGNPFQGGGIPEGQYGTSQIPTAGNPMSPIAPNPSVLYQMQPEQTGSEQAGGETGGVSAEELQAQIERLLNRRRGN